jgi:hypothetical protein
MKLTYLAPVIHTCAMDVPTHVMAAMSIQASNETGSYEKDDNGNHVINAKQNSLWGENEEQ